MLKLLLAGIAIGIANIIPGVSGGTIAFILGIYDKLTNAIGNFLNCGNEKRKEHLKFLIPLFVGMGLGVLIFAKVIDILYKRFPEPTSFFFIGLILASVPIILKENKGKINRNSIISLVGGILLVLLFLLFKEPQNSNLIRTDFTLFYYMKLLFCGVLAASAMIIPGISGSMLLLILGEYYNILSFVNNMNILPLTFVGIGIIIGVILCSRLISYLFEHYKNETIYAILGLILASLLGIWPGFLIKNALINILSVSFGICVVYFSEKISIKNKN